MALTLRHPQGFSGIVFLDCMNLRLHGIKDCYNGKNYTTVNGLSTSIMA